MERWIIAALAAALSCSTAPAEAFGEDVGSVTKERAHIYIQAELGLNPELWADLGDVVFRLVLDIQGDEARQAIYDDVLAVCVTLGRKETMEILRGEGALQ